MYNIICPSCGKKYLNNKLDYDDLMGKKVSCKKCQTSFTICSNDIEKKSPDISVSVPKDVPLYKKDMVPEFQKGMKEASSHGFWEGIGRHFAFKNMIFLSWAKAFYFISFVIAILTTIGAIGAYYFSEEKKVSFIVIIIAPWISLLWIRITMEFGILFFRIHEELVELNDNVKDRE